MTDDPFKETIISTDELYSGRVVTLHIHDVTLPDGKTSKREVVYHPGAVAMVAVDDEQSVLLVKQYRLPAGQTLYEIPAGTLEPDEAPTDCASRELREETGYQPKTDSIEAIGGIYTAPGYTSEYIHLFYITGYEPAPLNPDADEFIEVERIPLQDALKMIDNGQIEDAKTVTGLLRVARRLG